MLKSREDIATSFVDTFISVTNETIRDMDGNFVRGVGPSQPLPVNYYGEDITSPVLVSFTLDMDDGNLRMTFSETVDVSSLEISEVSIHNNRTGSSVTYNLTKLSNFTSADSPIVTLPLSIFDVNELKRLTNLAVQADGSDAFLSLTPSFVSDMNQNRITPIRPSDAKQAFEVTPDTTCPALSSFTLDMNTGYLTLYFDETVNSTSMDVSEIALLSSASREETYSLTTSSVESPDGPVIVILLSSYDADRIKIRRKLATSREDTWIHLMVSSLTDMAGNSYCNVSKVLQTSFHEADRERPILLSYSLDVNAGVLLFTFSEAFQLTDTTSITLLSFPSEQGSVNFTLTGGYVSVAPFNSTEPTLVRLHLSDEDLNDIKYLSNLASFAENTYLSVTSDAGTDLALNPLVEINSSKAYRADAFYSDKTRPRLLSYNFDADSGDLLLTFSETVNVSSVLANQFTLSNSNESSAVKYQIRQFASVLQPTTTSLRLKLSTMDLNEVKRLDALAVNSSSMYLSLTNYAVADMNQL